MKTKTKQRQVPSKQNIAAYNRMIGKAQLNGGRAASERWDKVVVKCYKKRSSFKKSTFKVLDEETIMALSILKGALNENVNCFYMSATTILQEWVRKDVEGLEQFSTDNFKLIEYYYCFLKVHVTFDIIDAYSDVLNDIIDTASRCHERYLSYLRRDEFNTEFTQEVDGQVSVLRMYQLIIAAAVQLLVVGRGYD